MQLATLGVHPDADLGLPGPSCSLIDSPTLDDNGDDKRATVAGDDRDFFDPQGLYQLEQERDEACAALIAAFPDKSLSLQFTRTTVWVGGEWSTRKEWAAMVHSAALTGHISSVAATPTEAVQAVIKAHRKATARVRITPEHRPLVSHTFEAFGRIDPSTAADFLELVEQYHGRNDFLIIEPDGRVMLATGYVECSEAHDIGNYIALHNLTPEAQAAEAAIQIVIEPRGDAFKAFLVMPSGERIETPCVSPTEAAARKWAQTEILARRSTVPNAAVDASASSAA